MEVGIAGIDAADPVFAHQNGRMGVVNDIALQERRLGQNLGQNRGVPIRRDEQARARARPGETR